MTLRRLDCVVIGYNEIPFDQYEQILRSYGEDSEAYRDLKFSFVELGEKKLDYVGLLNHVLRLGLGEASPAAKAELKSGDIPNLAAAYLTNYLRHRKLDAEYINLFQHEKERLKEYLSLDPICIAITTTFYVINLPVNEMIEFIRACNPNVKIIVGGPLILNYVRNCNEEELRTALADMGADLYVIEGQGEQTLTDLIGALKNGDDIHNIPNLAFFDEEKLHRTKTVPENNPLDENSVDWRGFPEEDLGRTLQTRTARSCAFSCSFCNYPTRAGKLTLSSVETVKNELDSMRLLGTVKNLVFIDDTFNVPLARFKDICRLMIREKYAFNWFSYFRCSNSDEEAIELMAESGCKGVFLGIESGSPSILKNMNKAALVEKYVRGIELLRRHDILTFGSFIIGFPGETDDTVDETIRFIRETRTDYYRAQLWYCETGTPIDRERVKYDIRGQGFVWSHATMDSLTAMDHIDRMFLTIRESLWLPQWSFDFWIIPYLIGKGVSLSQLREFMTGANSLLALGIVTLPEQEKRITQQARLRELVNAVQGWRQSSLQTAGGDGRL